MSCQAFSRPRSRAEGVRVACTAHADHRHGQGLHRGLRPGWRDPGGLPATELAAEMLQRLPTLSRHGEMVIWQCRQLAGAGKRCAGGLCWWLPPGDRRSAGGGVLTCWPMMVRMADSYSDHAPGARIPETPLAVAQAVGPFPGCRNHRQVGIEVKHAPHPGDDRRAGHNYSRAVPVPTHCGPAPGEP